MVPPNSYPTYAAGQLLKSEDLNDSFRFLENHIRATRNRMIGYGILDGLTFNLSNDKLTISEGEAVTKDGYMIHFKHQVYDRVVAHKATSDIRYAFYKADEDIQGKTEISKVPDISGYLLGIAVEEKSSRKSYCDPISCDISPETIELVCRPVLIKASDIQKFTIHPKPLDYVETERLRGVLEFRNLVILRHRMLENYRKNRDILVKSLESVQKAMPAALYKEGILDNEMPDKLKNSVSLLGLMADNMTEIPGYYLLFLNDLKLAINEFVLLYNNFIRNYRLFTRREPSVKRVILGQLSQPMDKKDEYRTVFRELRSDFGLKRDAETLNLALRRIDALISSFKQRKYIADINTVKIIPSRYGDVRLGEMSIPFYYNEIPPAVWQLGENLSFPVYTHDGFKQESLSDSSANSGFFRIDGYFGLDVHEVYEKIHNLIEIHNLPFNVVKVKLEKENFSPDKNDTAPSLSYYRKVFSKIISDKNRFFKYPPPKASEIKIKKTLLEVLNALEDRNTVFKTEMSSRGKELLRKDIRQLVANDIPRGQVAGKISKVFGTLDKVLDFKEKIDDETLGRIEDAIRHNEGLDTQTFLADIVDILNKTEGVGYNAIKGLSASSLRRLESCFKKLNPRKVYEYVHGFQEKIPEDYEKSKEILAYSGLENFVRKTIVRESNGIEYLGGIKENNTLVLLYFRNKTILCLNMPFFLKGIPEKYE